MRRTALAALAAAALVAGQAGPALADTVTVTNPVYASGGTSVVADGTASASVTYTIVVSDNNGTDPENGCNAKGSSPATLTPQVPAGVSVSPVSRTLAGCDTPSLPFAFTATQAGSHAVSVLVSDPGTGRYEVAGARFTLVATAPVAANTAPAVRLSGVTAGTAYEFGTLLSPLCTVTDAEDGTRSFAASVSGPSGKLGSQTATCAASDSKGLAAPTVSATYAIVDTTAPAVQAADDITVEATAPLTTVTYEATATDAVDAVTAACAPASGSGFAVGPTTVTCSATDGSGNTGSDDLVVTVTDLTAPALTLPAAVTAAATGPSGAAVTYDAATASDLVDGNVGVTCLPASGAVFPLGTTPVACTATDEAGNDASGAFDVTVQDKGKPVVTVPASITAEATSADGADVDFSSSALDDVDGPLTPTCDAVPGTFPLGTTEVTCGATDAAGNSSDASFSITVEDTTAPALTLPAEDVVAEATSPDGATVAYSATATDAVTAAPPVECEPASGSTFVLGDTLVTCTATDDAGNPSTPQSFTVVVQDTTEPNLTGHEDISGNEATGPGGAPVSFTVADGDDLVDGAVPTACLPASGSLFELGTTEVTCSATDKTGNTATTSFSVEVVDTTEPTVTTPANEVAEATSRTATVVTYGAATASDLVDGDVVTTCDPASGSDFGFGLTTVTCSATDAAGNTGTSTFTVTVQDTGKPVVSVPADVLVEATSGAGATATWSGVFATDGIDGAIPVTCDAASGDTFPLGTTTVTCTAEDLSGNEGSNDFAIVVSDTTAPVIAAAANLTAAASSAAGAPVSFSAPATSDAVDGVGVATCDRASGSTFAPGVTTVTCSASDEAGNASTRTFTVAVTYGWSGFRSPLVPGESYKRGSTIPVKFALTGTSAGIGSLTPRLEVDGVAAGTFRYDATAGQYIANLSTKPYSAGRHVLSAVLGDGVGRTIAVTLAQ